MYETSDDALGQVTATRFGGGRAWGVPRSIPKTIFLSMAGRIRGDLFQTYGRDIGNRVYYEFEALRRLRGRQTLHARQVGRIMSDAKIRPKHILLILRSLRLPMPFLRHIIRGDLRRQKYHPRINPRGKWQDLYLLRVGEGLRLPGYVPSPVRWNYTTY